VGFDELKVGRLGRPAPPPNKSRVVRFANDPFAAADRTSFGGGESFADGYVRKQNR